MNKQQISEINFYFQKAVGKYFQMFGGMMASLEDYKDQTIYLHLVISDLWNKRDALSTAFQMARAWRKVIPEFNEALSFECRCTYLPPGRRVGFAFRVSSDASKLAEQVADAVTRMSAHEESEEDDARRTITVSGLIDADIPCDMSPNRQESGHPLNYDEKAELN